MHRSPSERCEDGFSGPSRRVEDVYITFHPETWADFVEDLCDRKLGDLRRLHRSDPEKTKERLVGRIGALQTKISRARDLFIDCNLSRPDYEDKKSALQDEIELVQEELSKIDNLDDEIRRVEGLRRVLLSIENPLSGHYAFIIDEDFDESLVDHEEDFAYGFGYGSKELAAKRRQHFYGQVGLRVKVGEELEISLGVDQIRVSTNESVSDVISAPAPAGVPGSLSHPRS